MVQMVISMALKREFYDHAKVKTFDVIYDGIKLLSDDVKMTIMNNGDWDANDADHIFQLGVFGEVVMANKIDSGIHLVLTYEEAIAILRAMAEGRFAMESEHKDDLPHEEAKVG